MNEKSFKHSPYHPEIASLNPVDDPDIVAGSSREQNLPVLSARQSLSPCQFQEREPIMVCGSHFPQSVLLFHGRLVLHEQQFEKMRSVWLASRASEEARDDLYPSWFGAVVM